MNTEQLLAEMAELSKNDDNAEKIIQIKEKIIQKNVGLVISIAKKFVNSGEPLEDLVQSGYIGLLNAAHNFDLNKGAMFSTYATFLIQGEIRHYIRDKNSTIRIPQWLQKLSNEIKLAEENFYKEHGKFPSIYELSEELNIEEDGIREALKARSSLNYISIDAQRRRDDPRPMAIDVSKIRSKHREEFPIEYKVKIASAIEKLTELQQKVIQDLFYSGKSQARVGKEIGVSQRQVSRIKQDVLKTIKKDLQNGL